MHLVRAQGYTGKLSLYLPEMGLVLGPAMQNWQHCYKVLSTALTMPYAQGAMAFTTNFYFQLLAVLYHKTGLKTDILSSVWLKPVRLQLVLSLSLDFPLVPNESVLFKKLSFFHHIFSVCSVHEVSCHMLSSFSSTSSQAGTYCPRLLSHQHLPHRHCDTKQSSHLLLGKASAINILFAGLMTPSP